MCAISGIFNHRDPAEAGRIVRAMAEAMRHRGPDGDGCFVDDSVALGHRRLAVIDPEGGTQPLANEDGSVIAVVNGEIYNFFDLRHELEARGHLFTSACDSEVVVHLYEEYGTDFPRHLDGMFAMAVYDSSRRRLILVRDRLGQKPLLYFMSGGKLVFASEFCGLAQHPEMPDGIDFSALSDYLSLQYVASPDTIYRGVRKLPPGHLLEYRLESSAVSVRCYWSADFRYKENELTLGDAACELRRLVEKAVAKRLVADVPLGVFLSGGVDSTIVAGVAAKLLAPGRCSAFTIGFDHAAYDERRYAAIASSSIVTHGGVLDHHVEVVTPGSFELLRRLASHTGEPYADASLLPTFQLCRFARENITVALSGDGADEVFCGYERYGALALAGGFEAVPESWRRAAANFLNRHCGGAGERSFAGRLRRFAGLLADDGDRYFNLLDRCPPEVKRRLLPDCTEAAGRNSSVVFEAARWGLTSLDPVERASELDLLTYLPGDILTKVDCASMAVGLEVRSPFLDREVVEFAARLPLCFKRRNFERKRVLLAAFDDLLPRTLVRRPKKGFGVPVADWLRGPWREAAAGVLFEGGLPELGFNRSELEIIWIEHCSGKCDWSYLLWSLLNLGLFIENRGSGR